MLCSLITNNKLLLLTVTIWTEYDKIILSSWMLFWLHPKHSREITENRYKVNLCPAGLKMFTCLRTFRKSSFYSRQSGKNKVPVTLGNVSKCEGSGQDVVLSQCFYYSSSDRTPLCHTTFRPTVALWKHVEEESGERLSAALWNSSSLMKMNKVLLAPAKPDACFCQ